MKSKYKVGDTVKIKSRAWYDLNKNEHDEVYCDGCYFVNNMTRFCGKICTIRNVRFSTSLGKILYRLIEDDNGWNFTDEMFEENTTSFNPFKVGDYVKALSGGSGFRGHTFKVSDVNEACCYITNASGADWLNYLNLAPADEIKVGDIVSLRSFYNKRGRVDMIKDGIYYIDTNDKHYAQCTREHIDLVEEESSELKIGDTVTIKSLDWYNANKDKEGDIWCNGCYFLDKMSRFCGKSYTISNITKTGKYQLEGCGIYFFTREMFDFTKNMFELPTTTVRKVVTALMNLDPILEIEIEPIFTGDVLLIQNDQILTNLSII